MATANPSLEQWLEPARQALGTYRESTDRMFDLIPTWESFATDEETREVARLAHQAARARAAVAREWMISPLWLSGIASPSDLQAQIENLLDVDRKLSDAWTELANRQGQWFTRNARETLDATSAAVERTQKLADEGVKSVGQVVEQASQLVRETTEVGTDAAKDAVVALRPIKGNVNRDGDKIFHVPGQSSYEQLQTETLFANQAEALAAGYRISRSPGGPAIKGNLGRDGERIYHTPGQANYDRVEADALFSTEAEAVANGFRAAQR